MQSRQVRLLQRRSTAPEVARWHTAHNLNKTTSLDLSSLNGHSKKKRGGRGGARPLNDHVSSLEEQTGDMQVGSKRKDKEGVLRN